MLRGRIAGGCTKWAAARGGHCGRARASSCLLSRDSRQLEHSVGLERGGVRRAQNLLKTSNFAGCFRVADLSSNVRFHGNPSVACSRPLLSRLRSTPHRGKRVPV